MNKSKWFAFRFNAFFKNFPEQLNEEYIKNQNIFPEYPPEIVFKSLKAAYDFLLNISSSLLYLKTEQGEKAIEKVLIKINFLWYVCVLCEIEKDSESYFLNFEKKLLDNYKTRKNAPQNFSVAFDLIHSCGVNTVFLKEGSETTRNLYSYCDKGKIYFENPLVLQGLKFFVEKIKERAIMHSSKTLLISDILTDYSFLFYTADFNVFMQNSQCFPSFSSLAAAYDKRKYDYAVKAGSYLKKYKLLYKLKTKIYAYIFADLHFFDLKKNKKLFSFYFGKDKNSFIFKTELKGKEKIRAVCNINSFSTSAVNQILHEFECDCKLCQKNERHIIYKNKVYNNPLDVFTFKFVVLSDEVFNDIMMLINIKLEL